MGRSGYEAAYRFPNEGAAEAALQAFRAAAQLEEEVPSARLLVRALSDAEDLARLQVGREGAVLELDLVLHDDMDLFARESGGPSSEDVWDAIGERVESFEGVTHAAGDTEKAAGAKEVERRRAAGEEAFLVEDVLRGVPGLLDDPNQPGDWTARLAVPRDLLLEGVFSVGERRFEAELRNVLLRARVVSGEEPPPWQVGSVVVLEERHGPPVESASAAQPAAADSSEPKPAEPVAGGFFARVARFFGGS